MASRRYAHVAGALLRPTRVYAPSLLARPFPSLPRTAQPLLRRYAHSIPKPPSPAAQAPSAEVDQKTRRQLEPHYELTFTCVPCSTRSSHTISKQGYHKGSVLITCPSCRNRHIISDHLNIFGDKKVTIEDLMREKGQLVKRGTLGEDGDVEFWEDGTTTERITRKENDRLLELGYGEKSHKDESEGIPSASNQSTAQAGSTVSSMHAGARPAPTSPADGIPSNKRHFSTTRLNFRGSFNPPNKLLFGSRTPINSTQGRVGTLPTSAELSKLPMAPIIPAKDYKPATRQRDNLLQSSRVEDRQTRPRRNSSPSGPNITFHLSSKTPFMRAPTTSPLDSAQAVETVPLSPQRGTSSMPATELSRIIERTTQEVKTILDVLDQRWDHRLSPDDTMSASQTVRSSPYVLRGRGRTPSQQNRETSTGRGQLRAHSTAMPGPPKGGSRSLMGIKFP